MSSQISQHCPLWSVINSNSLTYLFIKQFCHVSYIPTLIHNERILGVGIFVKIKVEGILPMNHSLHNHYGHSLTYLLLFAISTHNHQEHQRKKTLAFGIPFFLNPNDLHFFTKSVSPHHFQNNWKITNRKSKGWIFFKVYQNLVTTSRFCVFFTYSFLTI
jgi:hypothetical protein